MTYTTKLSTFYPLSLFWLSAKLYIYTLSTHESHSHFNLQINAVGESRYFQLNLKYLYRLIANLIDTARVVNRANQERGHSPRSWFLIFTCILQF
jgi:hypothetical protein